MKIHIITNSTDTWENTIDYAGPITDIVNDIANDIISTKIKDLNCCWNCALNQIDNLEANKIQDGKEYLEYVYNFGFKECNHLIENLFKFLI